MANSRNGHAGFSSPATTDRLPPNSPEAEQGVLGCILLAPAACLDEARKEISHSGFFYDLRHQTIYESLVRMHNQNTEGIDIITLQQNLKNRGLLEESGGLAYLNLLPDTVPSAANLSYYLEIVAEKYHLRHYIQTCTRIVGQIYEHSGDVNGLLDIVEHDLRKLFAPKFDEDQTWKFDYLMNYDVKNDPNSIIGLKDGKTTRFLCKSHGCLIIAPSGVGKSVLSLQVGMTFAIGRAFASIAPVKKCKVLVVQGENDEGDCAEAIQGIAKSLGLDGFSETDEIMLKNLKVVRPIGKIGKAFCKWLEKKIVEFGADIVIVDPLLSFAGIDVSRQAEVTEFLRVWLGPVLHRTGAILIGVHHTGKPQRENAANKPKTLLQAAYDGIGSSEFVNWARAVILLDQCADTPNFRVMLSKRGNRAGATHPDGTPTQILWMRHATDGSLCWEQIMPPEEPEPIEDERQKGRPSVVQEIAWSPLHGFCAACKPDGETLPVISKRLEAYLAASRRDVSKSTCKKIVAALVANAKLRKADDRYFKGEEA